MLFIINEMTGNRIMGRLYATGTSRMLHCDAGACLERRGPASIVVLTRRAGRV
jgi:hypothetical protein